MFSDGSDEAFEDRGADAGFADFAEVGGPEFGGILDDSMVGFISSDSDANYSDDSESEAEGHKSSDEMAAFLTDASSDDSANASKMQKHKCEHKSEEVEAAVKLVSSGDEDDGSDNDSDDNNDGLLEEDVMDSANDSDTQIGSKSKKAKKSRKRTRDGELKSKVAKKSEKVTSKALSPSLKKKTTSAMSSAEKRALKNEMLASTSGLDPTHVRESLLLREFRVIGLVTNEVPFAAQRLGDTYFITTCVGRSFHVYEGRKLRLRLAARTTDGEISSLATLFELTFAAVGTRVDIFHRINRIGSITKHCGKVTHLLVIGHLLLTVGLDLKVYVWDLKRIANRKFDASVILAKASGARMLTEPIKELDLSRAIEVGDCVTAICHPPTYLNKVLLGFKSGKLELWNFNSGKRIYAFSNHLPKVRSGNLLKDLISLDRDVAKSAMSSSLKPLRAAVTCIEASPRLDVVGIGFANGMVVVQNVKLDECVMCLQHFNPKAHSHGRGGHFGDGPIDHMDDGSVVIDGGSEKTTVMTPESKLMAGVIHSISFRSDGLPQMCTVGTDGNIVLWNLKRRQVSLVHRRAHNERITRAFFLANEPILVTASVDNSLKMWLLEDGDSLGDAFAGGQLRLLKQRTGHEVPPHLVRFHGRRCLLSSANDGSLRMSWIQRDVQCQAFGQSARRKLKRGKVPGARGKKKLPRVVCLSSSSTGLRSRFMANIATAHMHDNRVRLWQSSRMALAKGMLMPPATHSYSHSNACCVCLSQCGQFAFVGRVCGLIDMYYVESCKYAKTFNGHTSAIRTLHVNLLNNVLISTSADKTIKFWSTKAAKCRHTVHVNDAITTAAYGVRSNILAVATDALDVFVYDGENARCIRKFGRGVYHRSHVTALTFNSGCQWLVTASMDGSVFIFDLLNGVCIDWLRFDEAVTSLAFAPNNTFLATTHVNVKGIHLWANKAHFGTPSLKPVGRKPIEMDRRKRSLRGGDSTLDADMTETDFAQLLEAIESTEKHTSAKNTDSVFDDDILLREQTAEDWTTDDGMDDSSGKRLRSKRASAMHGSDERCSAADEFVTRVVEMDDDSDDDFDDDSSLQSDDEFVRQSATLADIESQKQWLVEAIGHLHLRSKQSQMVTCSGGPLAFWVNLANWDAILTRNRASEKVRHDVKVPFFMASVPKHGGAVQLDTADAMQQLKERESIEEKQRKERELEKRQRILDQIEAKYFKPKTKGATVSSTADSLELSRVVRLLKLAAAAKSDSESSPIRADAVDYLLSLPPSAADAELRSVALDIGGEAEELKLVLDFFGSQIATRRNFEHMSALLYLFLKLHATAIARYPKLVECIKRLDEAFREQWNRVNDLFRFNMCLTKFFTDFL